MTVSYQYGCRGCCSAWLAESGRCEKRSSGMWSTELLESAEKLQIFRRRYIVGILTNKANISRPLHVFIIRPTYRLSTDSKTQPRMAIFHSVLFCAGAFGALKPGFQSLATLELVVNCECCRRTLNQKQLRHRAVSLRHHGFLVLLTVGKIHLNLNFHILFSFLGLFTHNALAAGAPPRIPHSRCGS